MLSEGNPRTVSYSGSLHRRLAGSDTKGVFREQRRQIGQREMLNRPTVVIKVSTDLVGGSGVLQIVPHPGKGLSHPLPVNG